MIPIYRVLNEDSATKIAQDWNVKPSGVGYVTRFDAWSSFLERPHLSRR